VIGPTDLGIDDTRLARTVIAVARTIAPCLDSLAGDARDDAIAILSGVAADAENAPRNVTSQKAGTASVTYGTVRSLFTDDDRAALRALCAAPGVPESAGHPVGRFPYESRALGAVWPERYDE
jgi:hypothetical protein